MLSFICFSVFLFCWAHKGKDSVRVIINANKIIYKEVGHFQGFSHESVLLAIYEDNQEAARFQLI